MEVRPNESSPDDGGIWAKVENICSLPSSAKPSEETSVLDTCIKVADEQWVKDPRVSGGEAIRKIIP